MERWLIVVAHEDDEAKSAGIIFKERSQKEPLTIVWMTNGEKGRYEEYINISTNKLIELRRNEALESAKLLNAEPIFFNYRDGGVPDPDNESAVNRLVQLIEKMKPSIIITHFYNDPHCDHRNTAKLVERAVKKLSYKIKYLYYEDQPSLDKNYIQNYEPNYFVDISDVVKKCLKIRTLHRTQFPERARDTYLKRFGERGKSIGVEYAMAFLRFRGE
jgi:LmbE family N-acetylglucosaminyl deacetylase